MGGPDGGAHESSFYVIAEEVDAELTFAGDLVRKKAHVGDEPGAWRLADRWAPRDTMVMVEAFLMNAVGVS